MTHFAGKELRVAKRRYAEFREFAVERLRGCENIVEPCQRSGNPMLMLDVTRNDLVFLKRDRQLPGQAHKRLRIR
jgi:hypothetical protein